MIVLSEHLAPMPIAYRPVRGLSRVSPTTFITSIVQVSSDIWLLDGFNPSPRGTWDWLTRPFRQSSR